MFYLLNPTLQLRGWQKLPYGMVSISDGRVQFASEKEMDVLKMANGRIDFDIPLISDEQRKIAEVMAEKEILIASGEPGSIKESQKYHFYDNRFISVAHWSVTGRCNYKCKHCYMSACENKYGELKHEDCLRIIDELAECGIHRVSLTGGEALVRNDFFELVDALMARDITIFCVYSNGRLVNEKTLAEFEKRNLYPEFNFSFDGTEGWHDWLRGVSGATESLLRAMKLCREHGFPIGAEMCLHDGNKHTLRDSVNFLAANGCQNLKTCPISDVGAWHDGGYGKFIDMKELMEIYIEYIPQYYEDGKPLYIQLGGFFSANPDNDVYNIPTAKPDVNPDVFCVCGHARNVMYISAEGRALPCMSLSGMEIQNRYPLILEHGLKECLTESTYIELITTKAREVLDHNEKCRNCEFANSCCGGCRASALETHPDDILGLDEASCLIMRGGYIDRIDDAVHSVNPNAKRGG